MLYQTNDETFWFKKRLPPGIELKQFFETAKLAISTIYDITTFTVMFFLQVHLSYLCTNT